MKIRLVALCALACAQPIFSQKTNARLYSQTEDSSGDELESQAKKPRNHIRVDIKAEIRKQDCGPKTVLQKLIAHPPAATQIPTIINWALQTKNEPLVIELINHFEQQALSQNHHSPCGFLKKMTIKKSLYSGNQAIINAVLNRTIPRFIDEKWQHRSSELVCWTMLGARGQAAPFIYENFISRLKRDKLYTDESQNIILSSLRTITTMRLSRAGFEILFQELDLLKKYALNPNVPNGSAPLLRNIFRGIMQHESWEKITNILALHYQNSTALKSDRFQGRLTRRATPYIRFLMHPENPGIPDYSVLEKIITYNNNSGETVKSLLERLPPHTMAQQIHPDAISTTICNNKCAGSYTELLWHDEKTQHQYPFFHRYVNNEAKFIAGNDTTLEQKTVQELMQAYSEFSQQKNLNKLRKVQAHKDIVIQTTEK